MEDKDLDIIRLYYQCARLVENRAKSLNKNVDFFSGQYACLKQLDLVDSISQKELSVILNVRATSLSESLAKLDKKGYINRVPSEKDKRTFLISITKEGKEALERAKNYVLSNSKELIVPLNEDEKDCFYNILLKIKDNFEKVGE